MRENLPLITVIITTYNRVNLLEKAILSVINQTYKNLEIIISDNHSEDGTEELCEKYAKTDSRIIYYRQENGNTCVDYNTKEKVNTKNIIVQKITYEGITNSKYWNLKTTGTGKGYYITNGYAVPITWKKEKRNSKTKYYYEDGTEIKVNDGRTYIEIQTDKKELTIS